MLFSQPVTMENDYVDVISGSAKVEQVHEVLQHFLKFNENVFEFPHLSENNKRFTLWSGLFQHLQNKSSATLHPLCLAAVRILSRDKTDLENLMCEKYITTLTERAGLYALTCVQDSMESFDIPERNIAVEAMKCLCNIAFNSEVARALCAHTNIAQGLGLRLRAYRDIPYKNDIMLYDMKLLFILTALRKDIKEKIRDELHGMDYLISCQNDLLLEATTQMDVAGACASSGPASIDSNDCYLNNEQYAIMCQILKTQFNLILRPGPDEEVTEEEDAMFLKLMPVLTALLYAHTSSEENSMELRSDVANLLISVPPAYYQYLTPEITLEEVGGDVASGGGGAAGQLAREGRNMAALQALVQLLQHRLTITTNTRTQYENLSPILTVLVKSARGCRVQRKHLRQVILPPLRDVSLPPERGDAVRNQLCRLLTTPVTKIRDLVAEFIFVLCKEKVGRMVKYTGFGNAAGHLAQRGLLGGGGGGAGYSSSSDDSDTDEYILAAPHIDPVVGCTRPPRTDPFAGMTDEQKEYEAMKLVNLFDQLVSEGVVRPARVGPDGRPQPVEHVLELRENPPNRPQS